MKSMLISSLLMDFSEMFVGMFYLHWRVRELGGYPNCP